MSGRTLLLVSLSGAVLLLAGTIYLTGRQREETGITQAADDRGHPPSTGHSPGTAVEGLGTAVERLDSASERAGDDSTRSDGMTPEAAKELLAEHRQIRDIEQRAQACSDVIMALCRAGHAAEAFALIDSEPGEVRASQIEALFGHSGWSLAEATKPMKLLVDQGGRGDGSTALSAYLRSLNLQDFRAAIHSPIVHDFAAYYEQRSGIPINTVDNLATSYVAEKIYSSGSAEREAYWRTAVDLHREGLISDRGLAEAIKANTSLSAFEKWDAFQQGIETNSGNDLVRDVRDGIVSSMVKQDAEKAMWEIVRVESPQASAALSRAAQQWMLNEGPGKVSEWYRANKDRLIPAHQDALAERFLMDSLSFGERGTAQQWADEVRDPRLKAECLTRLAAWDSKQAEGGR